MSKDRVHAEAWNDEKGDERRNRPLPPAPYRSFPIKALPKALRAYCIETARAHGVDAGYVAPSVLVATGAAIGNSRRLLLKRGWSEPANLWSLLVARTGTLKSPIYDAAVRATFRRQEAALACYAGKIMEHEVAALKYDADIRTWKGKNGFRGEPPEKPARAAPPHYVVNDPTVEALAPILRDAPRGVLLAKDELSAWLAGFDAYKNARGADVGYYLSAYDGRVWKVDRKSGPAEDRLIYVPRALVSIVGGVQPRILGKLLSEEHFENGLAARFMLHSPPSPVDQWREDEVSEETERAFEDVLEALYALEMGASPDGGPEPEYLKFTPQGKTAWIAFHNAHGADLDPLDEKQAAAWAKTRGRAARIALVVHLARVAGGDRTASHEAVDEKSVRDGVEIARWVLYEAERVYAALGATAADRQRAGLVAYIQGQGGRVSPRDLANRLRRYSGEGGTARAERDLEDLVKAGLGLWTMEGASRGPKAPVFVLLAAAGNADTDGFAESQQESGNLSASAANGSPRAPGDEPEGAAKSEPIACLPPEVGDGCGRPLHPPRVSESVTPDPVRATAAAALNAPWRLRARGEGRP